MAGNNIPVAKSNVWRLSNREALDAAAINKIVIYPGEEARRVAFDVQAIAGPGDFVSTISAEAVDPTGALTIADIGPRDYQAVLQLGGTGVAGTEYKITATITLQSGDVISAVGFVEVKAVPSSHTFAPPFA